MFRGRGEGRDSAGVVVLPPLYIRNSPNQNARTTSIKTVVLHDTEGSYMGAIDWLCHKDANASAHLVLSEDGLQATQLVPYDRKAWACMAYNGQSINIEMAGLAKKGYSDKELRVAARIVAFFLHKYSLPATHARPDKEGRLGRGWSLHQDLGSLGGGHHDPGFSPAKAWWFGQLVKSELKRGGFRRSYGLDGV